MNQSLSLVASGMRPINSSVRALDHYMRIRLDLRVNMTKGKTTGKAKSPNKAKAKPRAKKDRVRIIKEGNLHILTRSKPQKDEERENRITMEIVVDAYNEMERAMGWYYYLEEKLSFPFTAKCIETRAISPLRKGNKFEVIEMAPEEECQHEMFVNIELEEDTLAVPLSQLKPIDADEETQEAIQDWHYWVKMGYEF